MPLALMRIAKDLHPDKFSDLNMTKEIDQLYVKVYGVHYPGFKPGSDSSNGVTITDSLGRTVTVPENAKKFAAIGPGCLRLYCYVGDTSKLVGIENVEKTWVDYAGRPYMLANQNLLNLTIVGEGGPGVTPDAEKLISLGPDVIFTMYNLDISTVDDLQKKTGKPVVALSYGKEEIFDETAYNSLRLIGQVTGREERAQELINYSEGLKADLGARTKNVPDKDKPTVYLGAVGYYGIKGIQSTAGNYSLFKAVNARNVIDEDSANSGITGYASIDKEYLLKLDPDIIIIDSGGLGLVQEDYEKSPEFYQNLSAFKKGRVYMQLPYNYYYTNIETALANAYYIGKVLYPEKFSDVDVRTKYNEISTKFLGKAVYDDVAKTYFGGYQQLSFNKTK
jgi:iron complex transport system substrate-binding protein